MKNKYSYKTYILVLLILLSLIVFARRNKNESLRLANLETRRENNQMLKLAIDSEPSTLDPSRASDDSSQDVLINIMEPLTRLEEDEDLNNVIAPAGAESWDLSPDGRVWTFKIRDGLWSDGVAITANDYEYGIKRSINPKTAAPHAYLLEPIKNAKEINAGKLPLEELGVKAIDEKTLEITLESPSPYFLDLSYQRVMFPQREDLVKKYGSKYGSEPDTLAYNGPFVLSSWNHDSRLILEKNKNYWDRDIVSLKEISFFVIRDENTMINSFINGEIDQISTFKSEWEDEFNTYENIEHQQVDQANTNFLLFNTKDQLFSNIKIRKAFLLAIDREEISDIIAGEFNRPASGFVSSSIKLAGHEFRDLVSSPIEKLYEEELDPKALLAEGLKELAMDIDPSEVTVELALGSTDNKTRNIAEYLQENYIEKLGIDFKISQMERPVFESVLDSGDFQIASLEWKAEFNDPISFLNLFKLNTGILNNGWTNSSYDENLELADKEMYQSDRLKYLARCEEILLYDEAVIVPLTHTMKHIFSYDYVEKLDISPFSSAGYKYTYIDNNQ